MKIPYKKATVKARYECKKKNKQQKKQIMRVSAVQYREQVTVLNGHFKNTSSITKQK